MAKIFQFLILFISLGSIVNAVDITVSSSSNQNTWYASSISGNINISNVTTFSWETGIWSACNASCGGGIKTRTVVCRGSDGGVHSDGLCSGPKPNGVDTCNNFPCYTYSWNTGSWGSCSANPTWNTGSWGSCSANPTWNTGSWGSCSANPTWNTGSWGSCSATCGGGTQTRSTTCSGTSGTQTRSTTCSGTSGTQTRSTACSGTSGSENRTVTCQRSDSQTVVDGFCGGGKPTTSQSCTESCSAGTRPTTSQSCTESCSAGTRPTSSQSCTESCSAGTRPTSSQSCNTQACGVDCVGEYNTCGSCSSPGPATGGTGWYSGTKTCTLSSVTTPASGGGAPCPASTSKSCMVWKNSFIAGTKIKLEDGTTKNIEDIIVGDILKGSNNSKNIVLELKFHPHQGDLYAINGNDYFVTPGHPFMTLDGWKAFDEKLAMEINPKLKIKKLKKGDILLKENNLEIIQSISKIPTSIQVYNFEVSGSHDYYANGYLVHNK